MDEQQGTCPSPYVPNDGVVDDEHADANPPRGKRSNGMIFAVAITAIVFFLLGVFASQHGCTGLLFNNTHVYEEGEAAPASELASRMNEVTRYLDDGSLYGFDGAKATENVLKALLSSGEDKHAEYLNADYYEEYLQYSTGEYLGLGITIGDYGGYVVVTGVYENGPAAEAGVEPGYAVVAVDGVEQEWDGRGFSDALIRDEGEEVEVVWLKPTDESLNALIEAVAAQGKDASGEASSSSGEDESAQEVQVKLEGERITTKMKYSNIVIPNIKSEMKGDVGYIYLLTFNGESGKAVEQAVDELVSKGAKSLVLDLRNNGGGYLEQAVDIVSLFVGQGDVLQMRGKTETATQSVTGNVKTDLPLVLLVNEKSASASEIVAAALKDHGRATLVGTTTYGKGTVQNFMALTFGGAIKFTVAEYLSPYGNPINEVGVAPDVEVKAPAGFMPGDKDDPQLDKALEVAAGMSAGGAPAADASAAAGEEAELGSAA